MDILKFAQEGNVRDNPDYNPKTKKGALQPPTITDYNPGTSISDEGRSVLGRTLAKGIYDLNKYDIDKYTPYNVYVNKYDTEEELNKERAQNQGALEQTGRFLGQAVGSEVILGTLRGFSDLVDATGQLIGIADNDYTNPVSSQLAEWQDSVRESLEIYRENPDKTFDLGDFGWWTGNAVSIASTLSLLIPGTAVSKLGKVVGVGKLAREIGKVAGKAVGKPNVWGKIAESGSELMLTAAASRVAENYIEARDTYTQIYDESINRLAEMTPEQKVELAKNNPKFAGLSDEEIAKYVSGESADETFGNDMYLMLLDAWQLKGLKNIFKGAKNAAASRTLREANAEATARLTGRTIEKATGLKKLFRVPDKETILDIGRELSEGFEEGYQYVQSQYGIDKGRKMLNEQYQSRSLLEHMQDPLLWEQAFWGWLGGVAFQHIGSAASNAWVKYAMKNKDATFEGRKAEIDGRATLIDNYINSMNVLNQNLDPTSPILDDNGNNIINSDGSAAYNILSDNERDAMKEVLTDNLITNMTVNAVNKGNYDMLKDFLKSQDMEQYLDKSGALDKAEQAAFMSNIESKMSQVSELYESELNKVINNDVNDANIAAYIAQENTYNKIAATQQENIINNYSASIAKRVNDIRDINTQNEINKLIDAVNLESVRREYEYLVSQRDKVDSAYSDKKLNKIEHTYHKRNINKKINSFLNSVQYGMDETGFNAYYNENRDNSAIAKLNNIDKDIAADAIGKAQANRRKTLIESDINNTYGEIVNASKYVENIFKTEKDKLYIDTLKQLDGVFETNDIDEVLDYLYTKNKGNLSEETQKELDDINKYLNATDDTSEPLMIPISKFANEKARQKGQRPVATVNGQAVTTPPIDIAEVENIPTEEDKTDIDDSNPAHPSTGDQQKPPPEIVVNDEEDQADKAIKEAIAQQVAAEEKQMNADTEINNYILNKFLISPDEEFIALDEQSQYETAKNDLIVQGIDEETINFYLPKYLSSTRNIYQQMIEMQNEEDSSEHASSLDVTIGKIISAEEAKRAEYFKNLIDIYKANNNILTIDGIDYFNIISLMRFVINESNATFETAYQLYQELSDYLINNKDTGLNNVNPTALKLSKDKLHELVQDIERDNPELDNNFGVRTENEQGRAAFQQLKVGDNLTVVANQNGVELYVNKGTDKNPNLVKVGFNTKAKKTSDNTGYIFRNEVWTYTVSKTVDGYISSLDDLFDKLNPLDGVLSEEAKQFIKVLYDNIAIDNNKQLTSEERQTIKNEQLKVLKANTLFMEFFNTHAVNKNINVDVVNRMLNSVGAIYFYKLSDNLDANYQSYIDFIAKQYNNYKMTDTIMANQHNIKVTVKNITKGEAKIDSSVQPEPISKAIVDFDYNTHHLAVIVNKTEIQDVTNGTIRIKSGFNFHNMVVIVPNGTNEPHYAKVIPQRFDRKNKLGTAIRKELIDSIQARQEGNINYDELKDRLLSIFGVKNFIDGINCVEYDNRIILTTAGSNIPIITIYKYKNNSSELGNGITINPTAESGKGVGKIGWDNAIANELNTVIDTILDSANYSMSFDMAKGTSENKYVKHTNGKFIINIGGETYTYDNYLNYIVENNTGMIRLGKVKFGNIESNFTPITRNASAKPQLKVEYQVQSPVGDGTATTNLDRQQAINELQNKGNQEAVSSKELIKVIAPRFNDTAAKAISDEIIPDNVDIDTERNTTDFASFNEGNGRITLYKPFFDLARSNEYKAIRTLVHERLHARIFTDGLMNGQKFIDRMEVIRNAFAEAIANPTAHPFLEQLIKDKNYPRDKYLAELAKILDTNNFANKDYNYILEEFIVESLTNKYINEAMNAISSTEEAIVNGENETIWQKVIKLIRDLFGFGNIKDNTLLAQQLNAFSNEFKDNKSVEEKLQQEKVDEIIEETEDNFIKPTINKENNTIDAMASNTDDKNVIKTKRNKRRFSSIDIGSTLTVPNMNSIRAGLTTAERTQFDASLATGETQIYCI